MASVQLPSIDLSLKDTKYVAAELKTACQQWGFFTVKNHGIPIEDISKVFEISDEFFNSPLEEKKKFMFKGGRLHSGYTGHFGEKLDVEHQRRGDMKESYDLAGFPHPDANTNSPVIQKYFIELKAFQRECHCLSLKILDLIAIGFGFPSDFFSKNHSSSEDILRLLKYSVPEGVERQKDDEDAGAHSDYGSITLLFQKDAGGLQIRPPQSYNVADWLRVSVDENSVIVNIADMLQFWTSGRLKSTVHRVRLDEDVKTRQTIAYFVTPDPETLLAPVFEKEREKQSEGKEDNMETVTAGEWIEGRLNITYGYGEAPRGYLDSQNGLIGQSS
ncbi:iron/ascorbate oxidoreductase family protein [Schizosaccharomyces octosporus yFS286]|uniref:Iron/ascorbate oxidoreductase family protein n=1 Tax=Schizosaccharomyces octosporus (strain yFS286) TaxID=483514 RepID=S9RB59_SCHOY|nr:iron/ascorbate oxidoreductase family protein [Schizosaccharomyces octosporus yFS286]EPX75375.1 iron/ascorbate oxidoreductase family protein [Schizosaccharomyces octosporus yFS286]